MAGTNAHHRSRYSSVVVIENSYRPSYAVGAMVSETSSIASLGAKENRCIACEVAATRCVDEAVRAHPCVEGEARLYDAVASPLRGGEEANRLVYVEVIVDEASHRYTFVSVEANRCIAS